MIEVQKVNPFVALLQKIFSHLWNAGLFEDVDSIREQPLSKLMQKRSSKVQKELLELRLELMENKAHCHLQFKTTDGILLDGMLLNEGREKVILFVPGIGSFYERIADETSVISRFYTFFDNYFPDHSILMFNSRGIGSSSGIFDLKNLQIDTASAYHYLMDVLEYDLGEILLYAHSLGGLHAIQGAGLIQKKFPEALLAAVNDRSFGELRAFAKSFLKDIPLGDIAAGLVDKLGLNLSAKAAWESLKGQKLVIVSRHDRTIPYENASFCHHVKDGVVMHLEGCSSISNHHTRSFSSKEANQISSAFLS